MVTPEHLRRVRELMLKNEKRVARDVAKRCPETPSQAFRYAIARDLATRSSAADFKPRAILRKPGPNRARVEAKELPELLAKVDDYNGDAITRFAMKLMTYTFVRTAGKSKHLGAN
jgi:integrase